MSAKFRMPEKAQEVDKWVAGETAPIAASKPAEKATEGKTARLTVDLPQELHARFKAACAMAGTKMNDEVRGFIEEWTQKNR